MDKYTPALGEFLTNETTTAEDKIDLLIFLADRPKCAPISSLLPMEELEVRLQVIDDIRKKLAPKPGEEEPQLNYLQFATLMLLPLNFLHNFKQCFHGTIQHDLSTERLQATLYFMMKGRIPGTTSDGSPVASPVATPVATPATPVKGDEGRQASLGSANTKKTNRNANERKKCLVRDGNACVLMQTAMPEVCHILPFSISTTDAALRFFSHKCGSLIYGLQFGTDDNKTLTDMSKNRGWSDKAWNMLCLNRQLHAWWAEGYFALKYLGTIEESKEASIVQVQFHWMPRNGLDCQQNCTIPEALEAMRRTVSDDNGFIKASRASSGRSLATGQVFDIPVHPDDAPNMKIMIDLQWAIIRVAALSGAAGYIDELDKEYRDPWDEDAALFTGEFEDWIEATP
ncbi:HNH endonuclease domain-containing protein [Trichoderma breve]|uniref:HNH endonuclease domain-containing protein n=1 Tax=Trichoderma breve TaxID=2034170 RepID=A0A9W9E831_9HYPO|nr:HNH endonuclease domain-containing protein [Trichoderma breve]KAJ4861529.1 HNH endonuclease domain-containing protein [Trichoderma breve]